MFTCAVCKKLQPPRTPTKKRTISVREVKYHNVTKLSRGTEIAQEVTVCPSCASYEVEPETVGYKEVYSKELLEKQKQTGGKQ